MVFCPKCGKANPENAEFCNYCRYDLKKLQEAEKVQTTIIKQNAEQPTYSLKSDSMPQSTPIPQPIPVMQSAPTSKNNNLRNIGIGVIVIVAVIVVGIYFSGLFSDSGGGLPFVPNQYKTSILSGSITINAGSYTYYRFSIPTGANNPTLSGSFTASGGSGNDIKVYVMSDTDFTNWKNGHTANVHYNSGQKTTDKLNVSLSSGRYVLVFDNTFSLLTAKTVYGEIGVTYTK
jgi:ribosomal protein L40E